MPKTVRNIYENTVSFENLLLAHKKARYGKREKKNFLKNIDYCQKICYIKNTKAINLYKLHIILLLEIAKKLVNPAIKLELKKAVNPAINWNLKKRCFQPLNWNLKKGD